VFDDNDKLKDLYKINKEVKDTLIAFRKSLTLILKLLHQYQHKGIKFQLIEIFIEINFNNFYLNEFGETNNSTINTLTPVNHFIDFN